MTIRRFPQVAALTFVLVASVLVSQSGFAPAAAQPTSDNRTGTVEVAYGETVITWGASTNPGGPIWRCSIQTEDYGQWQTIVQDWGSLVVGQTYFRLCNEVGNAANNSFGPIVWDPTDPDGGIGISTLEIRDWMQAQMTPPPVPAALSPAGRQITGVETWLWPDGGDQMPVTTASAGPLQVSMTAELDYMSFDMGDGTTFDCTAFTEWSAGATNPECSHTYLVEPDSGAYELWAESNWIFLWLEVPGGTWEPFGTAEPSAVQVVDIVDLEAVITR